MIVSNVLGVLKPADSGLQFPEFLQLQGSKMMADRMLMALLLVTACALPGLASMSSLMDRTVRALPAISY